MRGELQNVKKASKFNFEKIKSLCAGWQEKRFHFPAGTKIFVFFFTASISGLGPTHTVVVEEANRPQRESNLHLVPVLQMRKSIP